MFGWPAGHLKTTIRMSRALRYVMSLVSRSYAVRPGVFAAQSISRLELLTLCEVSKQVKRVGSRSASWL